MIARTLETKLRKQAGSYPVVTLTGPRQSGKTTLVRTTFPEAKYVSLEAPDQRRFAIEDPRGFLGQFQGQVILDEAQRVPDLFSYIQVAVDAQDVAGRFILTGLPRIFVFTRCAERSSRVSSSRSSSRTS